MKIINRKKIIIGQNLADLVDLSWDSSINLNFSPDEMRLKNFSYNADTAGVNTVSLFCPTINETLFLFNNNSFTISPNEIIFNSKNYPTNTKWNFQILNINGSLNAVLDGQLMFMLEFIKFE